MNVLGTGSATNRSEAKGNKRMGWRMRDAGEVKGRGHKVNVQTFIYVLAMEYFKALQLP